MVMECCAAIANLKGKFFFPPNIQLGSNIQPEKTHIASYMFVDIFKKYMKRQIIQSLSLLLQVNS